jgi:autotransporter-associated beta strand protein
LRIGHRNIDSVFLGSINNGTNKVLSFTKTGTAKLTLGGTNNYTGPTQINAGILAINGSTGSSAITVANGGTLAGSGTLGGSATVQSGGIVSPGDGIGTLTAQQQVTMQSGSTLRIEIDPATDSADKLVVNNTLQRGGTLLVSKLPGDVAFGKTYTLFQSTTLTGSFSAVTLPSLPAGMYWNSSQIQSGILSVLGHPESWRMQHFNATAASGNAADLADPDGDGLVNLLEYATLSNPMDSNAQATTLIKQGATMTFTYTKNPNAIDVTYIVEWSDSLSGGWSSGGVFEQANGNQVTATIPATTACRFVRLRVVR